MRHINENSNMDCSAVNADCNVEAKSLTPLKDEPATPCVLPAGFVPIIKVPAVLAETTLQIVVEANIPLNPGAGEIKRVFKDVFITQCKLVPVRFEDDSCPGIRTVTRAKLFVEGFIRKDIEYATTACQGTIQDRIAKVKFAGFADLQGDVNEGGDFILFPILGGSSESRSRFIDPKHGESPRLDKFFFENSVIYNDQPYCELIRADFFELDFSPTPTDEGESFRTLREKIVVDLTLKVLQLRQVRVASLGNDYC